MTRLSLLITCTALMIALAAVPCRAQHLLGRWSLGGEGGVNYWVADYDKLKTGPGGQIVVRFGFSKYVGVGLAGGYEELKTFNSKDFGPGTLHDYMKMDGIPVSLLLFVHFFPKGTWNPYLYAGGGILMYRRTGFPGEQAVYPIDGKWRASGLIPVGLGFEAFTSNRVSLDVSAGFNAFNKNVDAGRQPR